MKLKVLMASLDREGFLMCVNLASFSCSSSDNYRLAVCVCAPSLSPRACVRAPTSAVHTRENEGSQLVGNLF